MLDHVTKLPAPYWMVGMPGGRSDWSMAGSRQVVHDAGDPSAGLATLRKLAELDLMYWIPQKWFSYIACWDYNIYPLVEGIFFWAG